MSTVLTIDCNYLLPEFAASFLMLENGEAAFIENNTNHSIPLLLKALEQAKISQAQVKYIIVTHIHLDHAGGTSLLAQLCPYAKILCHPRAARHLIAPEKLVSSAMQVYGEERFKALYGQINPIAEDRIQIMEDNSEIAWHQRTLKFIHTRGHANHHMVIFDSKENTVFSGDTFGIAYPHLQKHGSFVFPSTSPTDFDCHEAILSIEKVQKLNPSSVHFTHFGKFTEINKIATQMKAHLLNSSAILDEAKLIDSKSAPQIASFCLERLNDYYKTYLINSNCPDVQGYLSFMQFDLKINSDGLAWRAISGLT